MRFAKPALHSAVIAVFVVPGRLSPHVANGSVFWPVVLLITISCVQIIVPAPVAPSRRLTVSAVSAGAVVDPALKEMQSATCRTEPSAAIDAVACVPAAGLWMTDQREECSVMAAPTTFLDV